MREKQIFIKTFGCQMNDRDSEILLGIFVQNGYRIAKSIIEADVIFINTCSVRKHAEDRAISFLGTLKKLKLNKNLTIAVIGCMAKYKHKILFEKFPYIDIICGPTALHKLFNYVEEIQKTKTRIVDVQDQKITEDFYQNSFFQRNKDTVEVVISVGCSNYCSYCVVPYTRGTLQLRTPSSIIDQIKKLTAEGVKKIRLLGQNVNDYVYYESGQVVDFVKLLSMIASIKEIEELDFITSHPKNTSLELFKVMADFQNIKKHLHLPFQAGSDRILKLMNRGYRSADYIKLVENYYKIVKGTLSTDVIVGFPTETESDFLQTKKILETVKFKYAYIFKYSPRPMTEAMKLVDDVPEEEKERRHKVLLELQKNISLNYLNGTCNLYCWTNGCR